MSGIKRLQVYLRGATETIHTEINGAPVTLTIDAPGAARIHAIDIRYGDVGAFEPGILQRIYRQREAEAQRANERAWREHFGILAEAFA